ncbi:sugar isomerase domain-containing protein [Micromonospora globbae]|uniref:Sugar isomerase domain-containing protein n=1 Tax=Micromonospora globbae TaxID=1894969 RepID=A0A420EUZ3_9ACTN|nr:SIS domain-containing protein [Micromonospora globbae]RKF24514.1 sugar isomerase domain-containing protein [Micromonospora globbae]WTF85042.1 SIS domain-containing protein [Micromonospora globbae]
MTLSAEGYLAVVTETMNRVATTQREAVGRAADLIADAIRADGVVHAFGTGHSEALAMEIAGRAGGLVPTNRIALRDLVLHGGEPVDVLGPKLERDPQVAHRLYELAPVRPQDVFVLASNSGVNGAMVEFASVVKDRGHALIAITSAQHSGQMASRHPSGRKLADFADVVLDNGAPYGDATLPLPEGGAVGAVSSITAALLAQQITVEVVARLLAAGEKPPVYLSANIAGGDEHNDALEARYAGRIRRGA